MLYDVYVNGEKATQVEATKAEYALDQAFQVLPTQHILVVIPSPKPAPKPVPDDAWE